MIAITPITLGLPAKTATHLFVRPILYSTRETKCDTFYEVIARETFTSTDAEGNQTTTYSNTILATGNCPIPEDVYGVWGVDDTVIEDTVLGYLGLTRLVIEA